MENRTQREQSQEYGPVISTQTLSKDHLINLIYQGENVPQDKRFSNEYRNNHSVFRFFDVRDETSPLNRTKSVYPIVKLDDTIVGISKLEEKEGKIYLVKFVSIDEVYQDRKFSSKLLNEIMRYVKIKGGTLEMTSYTESGMQKLMNKFHVLAKEYEIPIIDEKKKL